ncbi:hypothetical protein [Promicromonospora umidemergens]|uniref:hypothetical protein n=1 Tax=Promicromonospora umidemergens TaxID=629679 RepID=UPI0020A2391F|nr:hypothetical protein [Promicromonospora umidemergens]
MPEGDEDLSCEGPQSWDVQVKSRQERIGDFSASEVAGHLLDIAERRARREAAGISGQPVLVLERPVDGELFAQWGTPIDALPNDHAVSVALRRLGSRRGLTDPEIESVARLVSVFVLPWRAAAEQARGAVASRHGLLPMSAEPVVLALRDQIAARSDANAAATRANREGLDRTSIERVCVEVIGILDQQALQEALTNELCEPADFDSPLASPGFYEGVAVQPGHIAAGLPTPRPDVTGRVVAALERDTSVLVTGPSGVGKSTVTWAAAYSTRHILWYRVRRLRETDVNAIVRLARAYRPSSRSPVGFVVDGVAAGALQAWDHLRGELATVPHVVLLGSVRTEDLLLLRSTAESTTIDVRLDEAVAAQIHAGLQRSGATTTAHWREAYDAANGLTLEYTHLLTRGRRLQDVLTEQVHRRVIEQRDTELKIIALVATAHRWAVDLPMRAVQRQIGAPDSDFREALARLNEEHLVHIDGTQLTGLHQLRSTALSVAVHDVPPPALQDSVETILAMFDDVQLQSFIVGVLSDVPTLSDFVVARSLVELERRNTPEAWTATLQALRIVDFQQTASRWSLILEKHGVQPALRSVTLQLALLKNKADLDLRPEITAAVSEIAPDSSGPSPLRDELVHTAGIAELSDVLATCSDVPSALRLLGVLAGTNLRLSDAIRPWPQDCSLVVMLTAASAEQLGDILAAAMDVSLETAVALYEAAGGQESVFNRLRAHTPFLVEVSVVERADELVGYARLMHISNRAIPDIDAVVRTFARIMLRCLPQCLSVDVQALLPGEVPLHMGDLTSGISQLSRRYDHATTAVTWNRMRPQITALTSGAMQPTERALIARTLVADACRYLDRLTRAWCVSRGRPEEAAEIESQRQALRSRAEQLTLPIDRADLFSVAADGTAPAPRNDALHTLIQGIVDNLTPELQSLDPGWARLVGFTGDTLRKLAARTTEDERWDLIDEAAPLELQQMDEMLADLHAVLAELAWGDLTPPAIVSIAREGPYKTALHRVADRARDSAAAQLTKRIEQLRAAAHDEGLDIQVWVRPMDEPAAHEWPPEQIAIGVRQSAIHEWAESLAKLTAILQTYDQSSDGGRPPILLVPLVAGRPVRALARQIQFSILPNPELFDTWTEQLGQPHDTPLTDAVSAAHQALQGLSGLAALTERRPDVTSLQEFADQEQSRFLAAFHSITELDDSQVVDAVARHVAALGERVQGEFDEPVGVSDTLAAGIATGTVTGSSVDMMDLDRLLTISLQWDLDPELATRLLSDT